MIITLQRDKQVKDATIGRLIIDNKEVCFTLEDIHRDSKVWGKTRIPAGKYLLRYRKEGKFHLVYSARFKDIHKGMIELADIPNYKYVLIHTGNTAEDTAGCILVGNAVNWELGTIRPKSSTPAYEKIYPLISAYMDKEPTYLQVFDEVHK